MQDYRVETKVSSDGSLIIKGLPFQAGHKVEVIIRSHSMEREKVQLIDKLISILDKPDKEIDELWAGESLSPGLSQEF